MKFTSPWLEPSAGGEEHTSFVPAISVWFRDPTGAAREEIFMVDSGADVSMVSRRLSEALGLRWKDGEPITLTGISPKPECAVPARIHEVEIFVPDVGGTLRIPICFADGDAPQLLGREGFFDFFRITFDKWTQETVLNFPT